MLLRFLFLYSFNFDVSYNFGFVINLLLVRYYVLLSNS
ncbi:putative membrane protein [Bacteroides fragilis str. S38L5]|nr:putative membrane protein [Bacteroides fragilis str. 3783N1-8]EYA97080.1 putative membrane protein [Bacteroides fragilis str. S38L5]